MDIYISQTCEDEVYIQPVRVNAYTRRIWIYMRVYVEETMQVNASEGKCKRVMASNDAYVRETEAFLLRATV